MKKKWHPLRWVIWVLAAVFFLYEYFIRVAPSVMIGDLMQAFAINATAIGSLSAFYFYIYAPLQLPVGMLTDKYGARRLLSFSSLITGLGALFFAIASHYLTAAFGRFLMGVGGAFGFVGMVYVCSHWFEEKKRGILIGLGNTVGMLGAILGQGPLRIGINLFGWRGSFFGLAIFGTILAILIYFLFRGETIKKSQKEIKAHTIKALWKNLFIVGKNSQSWINAISALFLYVVTATFAGLWGIPFIHTAYDVSLKVAGFAVSMIFAGWAVGGPIIGIFSDKIRQKKSILVMTSLIGAFLMLLVIYIPNLHLVILFGLLFLTGFVSSSQLLNFSYAIDVNPQIAKGTAAAFTNFIVVIGTAVLQPFIGFLLDLNWDGTIEGGVHVYSLQTYKFAMSSFPLSFFLCFLFSLFLKKSPHPA